MVRLVFQSNNFAFNFAIKAQGILHILIIDIGSKAHNTDVDIFSLRRVNAYINFFNIETLFHQCFCILFPFAFDKILTNQKTGHLLHDYQREPGRNSFPGFSASNMATALDRFHENVLPQLRMCSVRGIFVLLSMWKQVRRCCAIFSIAVVIQKCDGKGRNRGVL